MKRVARGAAAPCLINSQNKPSRAARRFRHGRYNTLNSTVLIPDICGYNSENQSAESYSNLPDLPRIEHAFFVVIYSGAFSKVDEFLKNHPELNVNCKNFEGYTPLTVAVKSKYEDIVMLLLQRKDVLINDALLHAVNGGSIPIVQAILAADPDVPKINKFADIVEDATSSSDFRSDMTPLMLASQRGHYEIIALLLKGGHQILKPHHPNCSCHRQCKALGDRETLSHSLIRLNVYRALASPVYICQTSKDPILMAFKLSDELKDLANIEKEFKNEYIQLAKDVSTFAADLLSQCRTTTETLMLLNRKEGNPRSLIRSDWKFTRVGLAIDGEHKRFVAHSNCQQVLRAAWVDGWPGWKRMGLFGKLARIIPRIAFLPFMALLYWFFPTSSFVQMWRKPLNKFYSFVASYVMFLGFLLFQNALDSDNPKRGPPDTGFEPFIMLYIIGYTRKIIKTLWIYGLAWFFKHKWNLYDIVMLLLFYMSFGCWISYWCGAVYYPVPATDPQRLWNTYDPTFVGEACYAIAVLLAFGKLMFFFQTGDGLGSLQISMSQMFCDIGRFLAIFAIIMFAFAIGMYKLYHYYTGKIRIEEQGEIVEQLDNFSTVTKAFVALYWAIYGYGDPKSEASFVISQEISRFNNITEVAYNHHHFTEAVGQVMFAFYHIICIIMLINMLIAMMSSTFLNVQRNADKEWKFNRTKVRVTSHKFFI